MVAAIYREIIIPGNLRWCRILSIHSITAAFCVFRSNLRFCSCPGFPSSPARRMLGPPLARHFGALNGILIHPHMLDTSVLPSECFPVSLHSSGHWGLSFGGMDAYHKPCEAASTPSGKHELRASKLPACFSKKTKPTEPHFKNPRFDLSLWTRSYGFGDPKHGRTT